LLLATRIHDHDAVSIVHPAAQEPKRYDATSIGRVGIFPCIGGRDGEATVRLENALQELRSGSGLSIPFDTLHRGDPAQERMDSVWYHGPGFWLERG
jgi:protein-L-isoaspartate(D-aspartate) O-methyltransferase